MTSAFQGGRGEGVPQDRVSLFRHEQFTRFLLASVGSQWAADAMSIVLPLIAVVQLAATPAQMGVLASLHMLPFVFLGPFIGALTDRFRLVGILIGANLVRAVAVLGAAAGFHLKLIGIPHLYALALLLGTCEVWTDIAAGSYLPTLVATPRLVDANSKLEIGTSVANTTSLGAGGWLIQHAGVVLTLILNVSLYICAAAILAFQPLPAERREHLQPLNIGSIFREIVAGVRYIVQDPILWTLTRRLAAWQFVVGAVLSQLVLFETRFLEIQPTTVGIIGSLGGVGVLIGALAVNRIHSALGVGNTIIACAVATPAGALLVALAQPGSLSAVVLVALSMALYGFWLIVYQISNASSRQARTSPGMLGRMNASNRLITLGANACGAFAGGLLAQRFSVRRELIAALVLGLAMALMGMLSHRLRQMTTLPSQAPMSG
jgi:MFS family permease